MFGVLRQDINFGDTKLREYVYHSYYQNNE